MPSSTSQLRHAFVDSIRQTSDLALLDFTRDDYRTVIIACLNQPACRRARSTAALAGYTVTATWKTAIFHYVVFTTPTGMNPLPDSSEPPEYIVEIAEEYFADTEHSR